jgi:hypothetical protein
MNNLMSSFAMQRVLRSYAIGLSAIKWLHYIVVQDERKKRFLSLKLSSSLANFYHSAWSIGWQQLQVHDVKKQWQEDVAQLTVRWKQNTARQVQRVQSCNSVFALSVKVVFMRTLWSGWSHWVKFHFAFSTLGDLHARAQDAEAQFVKMKTMYHKMQLSMSIYGKNIMNEFGEETLQTFKEQCAKEGGISAADTPDPNTFNLAAANSNPRV